MTQHPDFTPKEVPVDARKVHSDPPSQDVQMKDVTPSGNSGKNNSQKEKDRADQANKVAEAAGRSGNRQTGLTPSVNKAEILNRILDASVTMTVREVMETAKEIRTEFQELIKVRNVRAVYLGKSSDHPLIASLDWPRSEGVLIKVEMETGGRQVVAIVDTGSQLDVVRADVAALTLGRTVDMTRVTSLSDANGGRGQLRGWIEDVEFNCGGAVTHSDLWVSQKAPFELLLGRPWQRGNLVSIDKREEGTYLIFKDRQTKRPRYELLAIPQEAVQLQAHAVCRHQYESFTLYDDNAQAPKNPERTNCEVADELRTTARAAGEPETTRNEKAQDAQAQDAQALQRNPEEQVRLIGKEILQLLRIWLAIWSLMGGWILIYLETKVRQQNAKDAYKREEGGVPSHTQQLASDMTNITPDSDPSHEPPHTPSLPNSQTYEPIMFLDRTTTARPRCRDSDTSHLTPIQVIDYSVR
jgi:hypothetical protein